MSITVKSSQLEICDFNYLPMKTIRDINPRKKRGVTDYYIDTYLWYGKRKYIAVIDCTWINFNPFFEAESLREASNFIRKYIF